MPFNEEFTWKSLWICCKTDYSMNDEYTILFHIIFSLTCFGSELSSGSYIKGITRDIYFLFMAQQPIAGHNLIYAAQSHSQQTDNHTTSGIWTCKPSKQAATDPRLRPHRHWVWPYQIYVYIITDECNSCIPPRTRYCGTRYSQRKD